MVRVKPDLFLTVPNAIEGKRYSRADTLITPPCYVVSAPPPAVTPMIPRSNSCGTDASPSTLDSDIDDEEEEEEMLEKESPWTADQDELLLSVNTFHLELNS